ncbi:hypothetical protein AA0242T_1518 [Acetobacter aceti NRIC 0242]|nr:hypothetical protein AA0242T_1518 [Acetobacter aceti NRIC 0242]
MSHGNSRMRAGDDATHLPQLRTHFGDFPTQRNDIRVGSFRLCLRREQKGSTPQDRTCGRQDISEKGSRSPTSCERISRDIPPILNFYFR